jgi:hypothetical protein
MVTIDILEIINIKIFREVQLSNFDKTDLLAQDMQKMKIVKKKIFFVLTSIYFLFFLKNHITLRVAFPPNYPFAPPYVRVIKPRFQFRTGHVTIGGSICMEMLTNMGWSPGKKQIFREFSFTISDSKHIRSSDCFRSSSISCWWRSIGFS